MRERPRLGDAPAHASGPRAQAPSRHAGGRPPRRAAGPRLRPHRGRRAAGAAARARRRPGQPARLARRLAHARLPERRDLQHRPLVPGDHRPRAGPRRELPVPPLPRLRRAAAQPRVRPARARAQVRRPPLVVGAGARRVHRPAAPGRGGGVVGARQGLQAAEHRRDPPQPRHLRVGPAGHAEPHARDAGAADRGGVAARSRAADRQRRGAERAAGAAHGGRRGRGGADARRGGAGAGAAGRARRGRDAERRGRRDRDAHRPARREQRAQDGDRAARAVVGGRRTAATPTSAPRTRSRSGAPSTSAPSWPSWWRS